MCGIPGQFRLGTTVGVPSSSTVDAMLRDMAYRGPDGTTTSAFDGGVLGCARLSIVGGSEARQPISCTCCSVELVCNGEIYNGGQLEKLAGGGHRRSGSSDCEILGHLLSGGNSYKALVC